MCGDLDTDLLDDFFQGFANGLKCNIAVWVPYGRNDHHKIEAIFKAFGRSLKMACSKNKSKSVLSTKNLVNLME
jgi:imidazoleglycerol-phosphate dehydratase